MTSRLSAAHGGAHDAGVVARAQHRRCPITGSLLAVFP
jgi:hypothetical protein